MNDTKKIEIMKLVKDPSYMSFWFATSFSMTASNMVQFLLSLYVMEKTGSALLFASMISITVLPRILFTPIAGVYGDRIRRLKIMKFIIFCSIICQLFFALISTYLGELPIFLIYVLVILLEMTEVFYQAAESGILPEIIPKELLEEAVSLSKLDDGIVYTATPAIGTVMYNLFGVQGGLWMTVALFFISFLFHFGIKTPHYQVEEKKEKKSFFKDFRDGFIAIREHSFLRHFIFISPLMTFFFSSVYSVVVTHLFLVALNVGETGYGIYRTITASMVIFVPLFVIPIIKKVETSKLVAGSSFFVSISLFALSVVVYYVHKIGESANQLFLIFVTVIDCLEIAVMMPTHMSVSVLLQKTIPDEFRSRIFSVNKMVVMVAIPIGNIFFGVLTDIFSPHINIAVAAIGILICSILYRKTFSKMTKKL